MEYQENFGESIVPSYRSFDTQKGHRTVGFNRMFQLYRGYANSDRAQNQKQGRLTWELGRNLSTPIYTPGTGKAMSGTCGGNREKFYRVTVMPGATALPPAIRRSTTEFLVPYEQLSSRLQRINRTGSKVIKISPA